MARRKAEELLEDLEPTTEEQDLWDFLDTVGDSATEVDICQMLPGNRRPYRTTEIFSVFRENPYLYLRETLGEGKYLVKFKGSDKKIRRSKVIEVGAAPGTVQATAVPSVNGDGRSDFLREQLVMQQNLITALITSMKPPEMPDVGSLLQGIAALAPKPTVSDPAAMLTAVATVFTTLRGPEKDEDWLARAKTIIELGQSIAGGGNHGEDSGWSVLKEVGKEVARKIDLSAIVPTPNRSLDSAKVVAHLPASGDGSAPIPQISPEVQNRSVETTTIPQTAGDWIKIALTHLKSKAALNKDVGLYIDYIIENPEEPQNGVIHQAIKMGVTFEQLLEFDPEIGGNPFYRAWFEQLYKGLKDGLGDDGLSAHVDTGGPRGNASNVTGHEKTGSGRESDPGDSTSR